MPITKPIGFVPDYSLRARMILWNLEVPFIKGPSDFTLFFKSVLEKSKLELNNISKLQKLAKSNKKDSLRKLLYSMYHKEVADNEIMLPLLKSVTKMPISKGVRRCYQPRRH